MPDFRPSLRACGARRRLRRIRPPLTGHKTALAIRFLPCALNCALRRSSICNGDSRRVSLPSEAATWEKSPRFDGASGMSYEFEIVPWQAVAKLASRRLERSSRFAATPRPGGRFLEGFFPSQTTGVFGKGALSGVTIGSCEAASM